MLRLPWEVRTLFAQWLRAHYPERAQRVLARVRDLHGGREYDAAFGERMTGRGVWADLWRQRFAQACRRHGLHRESVPLATGRFRPPAQASGRGRGAAPPNAAQLTLFD